MTINHRLEDIRQDYLLKELRESDVDANPVAQFKNWLDEAFNSELEEPTAMTLATVSATGKPSARIVLLKHVDEQGFDFYSNYESRKGLELQQNPQAALLFFWPALQRQVRIEGTIERLNETISDAYFASRPLSSRLGAIASPQSSRIPDRNILEERMILLEKEYEGKEVERPANWGGFKLIPDYLEFWQGRASRLHDRLAYQREGNAWQLIRLAP